MEICCNTSQSAALFFGYTFSLRTSKRARETERATNRSGASAVSMVCDCFLIHQFELNWIGLDFAVKVGNSVTDSAWGRLSHGTRLLTEGGFKGVYKQTFSGFGPNEQLRKTYACYLSTSNGPVGGTLYITNQKFAFCSDRPLPYAPISGQQAWSYYKVMQAQAQYPNLSIIVCKFFADKWQ